MSDLLQTICLVIFVGLTASGCAGPIWPRAVADTDGESAAATVAGESTPARRTVKSPASATESKPGDPKGDPELQSLLAQLKTGSDLDPAEAAQLAEDLRRVPESLRPTVVYSLRKAVEDRRRARQSAATDGAFPSRKSPADARPVEPLPSRRASTEPGPANPLRDAPLSEAPADNLAASTQVAPARSFPAAEAPKSCPLPSPAREKRSSASDPVSRCALQEETPVSDAPPDRWREMLAEAIRRLEIEIDRSDPDEDAARREALLRLLYLAAGRREEAVRPIDRLDATDQEFWTNQINGLATYLDAEAVPIASRRAALALRDLRRAVDNLAASSNLDVCNLALCTDVWSYGRYKEFPKYEFRPGQPVILYVEVDNFAVNESRAGFETALEGSYQILDRSGHTLADRLFHVERDVCRRRRRDYYIHYETELPRTINPGRYTLQVTVEDTLSKRFGQSSVDFTIRPDQG